MAAKWVNENIVKVVNRQRCSFLAIFPTLLAANHPSEAWVVSSHSRSQIDLEKTKTLLGKKFHCKIGFSVV